MNENISIRNCLMNFENQRNIFLLHLETINSILDKALSTPNSQHIAFSALEVLFHSSSQFPTNVDHFNKACFLLWDRKEILPFLNAMVELTSSNVI